VERQQDRQLYHVYARDRLRPGHVLPGPAIVEQVDSTTVIPPAWLGTVDGYGNLILGTEEWPEHA
jgi:N-methylhydantoinase A